MKNLLPLLILPCLLATACRKPAPSPEAPAPDAGLPLTVTSPAVPVTADASTSAAHPGPGWIPPATAVPTTASRVAPIVSEGTTGQFRLAPPVTGPTVVAPPVFKGGRPAQGKKPAQGGGAKPPAAALGATPPGCGAKPAQPLLGPAAPTDEEPDACGPK
ncbi:MAG: hypothetical protein WC969_07590 [Elusimicrobiota bacterium]|jgi:hypothetical protein